MVWYYVSCPGKCYDRQNRSPPQINYRWMNEKSLDNLHNIRVGGLLGQREQAKGSLRSQAEGMVVGDARERQGGS